MQPLSPDRTLGVCLTFKNREARDVAVQKMELPPSVYPRLNWQKRKVLQFEYEARAIEAQQPLSGVRVAEKDFIQLARFMPDDRTLITGSAEVIEKMILTGPKSASPLTQTASWKAAAANSAVAIAIDAAGLKKFIAAEVPPNPIIGMFSPLWDTAVSHTLGLTVGDKTQLNLTSLSKDAAGAQKIEATLKAGVAMLSNMLAQAKNSPDPVSSQKVVDGLMPILEGHKIVTQGTETTLTLEADLVGVMASLAGPFNAARAAAQRAQQQNNLKQILLAMHSYADTRGHFPPAVIIDPQSKVARSWRVELLPYLDQALLYEQYKKDQPWDSEANKKVLATMPFQYRHPSQGGSTNTAFTAAYGKGLIFEENDTVGTKFQQITDGTSNTIAVVESKTEIPWTKPEDLTIDMTQEKLPEFGGFEEGIFLVGMSDGATRVIAKTIDIATLKKLFTKAGGEVIEGFSSREPSSGERHCVSLPLAGLMPNY